MNRLSIIVPIYNEDKTLNTVVSRIINADSLNLEKEIILVDDCSKDHSWEMAQDILKRHGNVKIFKHPLNKGKGAALRTGFSKATGDLVLIQDADLEYEPKDYPRLLNPIISGKADVVYGSRFRSSEEARVHFFWHRVANACLTLLSNICTNLNLTDMETGYKVFRKSVLDKITLKENRFGIEPELTIKTAKIPGIRFYEVGISYAGRGYDEGKKIGIKDAFRAVYSIVKYSFLG